MALSETTVNSDVTLVADFRAWATAVRDQLTAAGLTRTSDTGQIDLTTVSAPAINTYAGYDIFQFTDSDQTDTPIFFKLEYGKAANTARPALRLTLGTASNGSGTITGADSAQTIASPGGSVILNNNDYMGASYFDGGLLFMTAYQNGQGVCFLIERCKERDTGDLMSSNIYYLTWTATGTGSCRAKISGSWVASNTTYLGASSIRSGKMVFGGVYPQEVPAANMRCLATTKTSALAAGDAGAITNAAGASMTYKKPNTTFISMSMAPAQGQSNDVLIRTA